MSDFRSEAPEDPPPILGRWSRVYLVLALQLAAMVAVFYAITRWAS